jgi:hypothetical protein
VQWNPLATNRLTGTTFDVTDVPDAGLPHRFYRARLAP